MDSAEMKGKAVVVEDEYVSLDQLAEGMVVDVKVMVCCKWDAANYFGKCLSTEYILFDCQGNSILCSARSNIFHRFVCKLHEDSVYSLKNFSVLPNKEKYRIRRSDPLIISLEGYTVVKKLSCPMTSFVRFPFQFTPLEDVECNESTFLIDVIGCVVNIGNLRTTNGGTELLECEIVNERSHLGLLCTELIKRKAASVHPCVVIFPSMKAKEFRGEPFLSSTSATTLFDYLDIPQITTFITLLKKDMVYQRFEG